MAQSSMNDDFTPVKEKSFHQTKLSPEDVFYFHHLQPEELREKFIQVNEDFLTLKKYTRKQEDKIIRLQTKLRKLVSDYKRKNSFHKPESFRLLNLEHKDEIESLKAAISQLESKVKFLEGKLHVANVQLKSARQSKTPFFYRHITSRIDSGLKQTKRSNTPLKSTRSFTREDSIPAKQADKDGSVSEEKDGFLLDSPNGAEDTVAMSDQVRHILEEARKRILELEEDQEQLLQHLNDTLQKSEDCERELGERLSSVERELELEKEKLKDFHLQEQKDKINFIRSERQNKAIIARMSSISEHMTDVEGKLLLERKLKEEALETLSIFKDEEAELQTKLKTVTIDKENLHNDISDLKENSSYLKSEKEEKFHLLSEISREKEKNSKAVVEVEKLKISNNELSKSLEMATNLYTSLQHQKVEGDDTKGTKAKICEEKPIEMKREATYDKITYVELQNKYTELQLLYREKKLEFDKISSLLSGHANTYEQLQKEKHQLKIELEREIDASKRIPELEREIDAASKRISELESTLSTKGQSILVSDKQQLEFEQLQVDKPFERTTPESIAGDVMYLNKHHNVLEITIDKGIFVIPVEKTFKTFVSWIMPFPLRDPLQHTNFAVGSPANYKHTSLFKFKMNFGNLNNIKEESLKVNVYLLLSNNHPHRIGTCLISIGELLRHPQNTLDGSVSISRSHDLVEEQNNDDLLLQEFNTKFKSLPENEIPGPIGKLFYSIRFLKTGDEYINRFRRKMSDSSIPIPQSKDQREIENVKETRLIDLTTKLLPKNSDSSSSKSNKTEESYPEDPGNERSAGENKSDCSKTESDDRDLRTKKESQHAIENDLNEAEVIQIDTPVKSVTTSTPSRQSVTESGCKTDSKSGRRLSSSTTKTSDDTANSRESSSDTDSTHQNSVKNGDIDDRENAGENNEIGRVETCPERDYPLKSPSRSNQDGSGLSDSNASTPNEISKKSSRKSRKHSPKSLHSTSTSSNSEESRSGTSTGTNSEGESEGILKPSQSVPDTHLEESLTSSSSSEEKKMR